ncbi:MFS transporter prlL [Vanrija pseudolonga]|uniref:MFS transporter prlL n=1 Tax=Vanrija pseudolonga TaxID=143232 RepID=A0AAF0YG29_9TREE|nr:MFS transporter prlL [Vanrija pseudolonga]
MLRDIIEAIDEKGDFVHDAEHRAAARQQVRTRERVPDFIIDPEREKALVRKMDLHMMPMLWVMLLMNYIARTNIGNAKIGGMLSDLNMSSNGYSLVLSIFYAGYLIFEVPSNMLLSRSQPRVYLPMLMVIWGGFQWCAKGITSVAGMAVFRFVLGLAEAGFYPGVMFLMSCWYKPHEGAVRMSIFYSATLVAGAFGSLLAGGIIESMDGLAGTHGWQWLFIIEGCVSVVLGVVAYFVLPNYPATTPWLTEHEKQLATRRILYAQAQEEGPSIGLAQAFKEALKDPKTWCFLLAYNFINPPCTITYFIPTLVEAMNYEGRMAQFMAVPVYLVSLVFSIIGGIIADRTRQKAAVIAAAGILSTFMFVFCAIVQNAKIKYVFLCFGGAGIWTALPVFLSWVVIMFDGREKRAIAIAWINGFGQLSSIYGAFFWPEKDAPRYATGFTITCSFTGFMVVMVIFTRWAFGDKGVWRTS